jgi:hypothetical protein
MSTTERNDHNRFETTAVSDLEPQVLVLSAFVVFQLRSSTSKCLRMDSAANSTASAILEREETNCQLLAQKWDGQQSTELLFDSSWNLTWPLLDSSWDDGSFISDSVILKSPSDAHLPPSSDRAHQQYGQAAKSAAISTRSSKRKRKVPTVRADSWELYKERILKLHIDQGLPLPQVRIQMESDCGFIAQ